MAKIKISDFKGKKLNVHTHTTRCQHAKGTDREYVEKAIEAGYDALGFSDHAPYVFEDNYVSPIRMRMEQLEDYVDSIVSLKNEYENEIEIYCGLEMEYFPKLFDRTIAKIEKYPVDYLILGQHFYDDEIGWTGPKRPWDDEEHLKMYVDRVLAGLATKKFFYVAHPDIMCFTGDKALYRKYMMQIVKELKLQGMPIEVNMNGFRDGLHYPSEEFIKMGIENGNDFIIGVDAHEPELLLDFENYDKCVELVTKHGGNVINRLR